MRWLLCLLLLLPVIAPAQVKVGSKRFIESYVLGEIAKGKIVQAGGEAEHKQGLGGTAIVWEALKAGEIDFYPEYTGTIAEEILKKPGADHAEMEAGLREHGIGMSGELGFNNTYAFVMRRAQAEELGITSISELQEHPGLSAAITPEFLERADGWKAVSAQYGFTLDDVRSVDHALGYEALSTGQVDIKDAYSTDAQIADLDLAVLRDDKQFFPQYRAVFLYRLDAPPEAIQAIKTVEGSLDDRRMTELNAEATRTENFAAAAQIYLQEEAEAAGATEELQEPVQETVMQKILSHTGEHLILVGVSLLLAIIVGVPLGIFAAKGGIFGQGILAVVGLIQTIPSIALLLFLIPAFGLGAGAAITALFLYSLLPIVRNTAAGLQGISPALQESANAMGLSGGSQLSKIKLPLASPTIVAGIKTSAIINVGTATLAAFIGAGGLGEPIVSGLALNSIPTMMQGAIPAAILALLVQGLFEIIERLVVPKGLRL